MGKKIYYSQYGQDKFLNENVFNGNKGFFLEMGADDGITHSNTLFFEKECNWTGICVEPRKSAFEKLKVNRQCFCENVCISNEAKKKAFLDIDGYSSQLSGLIENYDNKHIERIQQSNDTSKEIEVDCITINDLLGKHKIKIIDYFSLDTEGGELGILSSINYNDITINCISVENKYKDPSIKKFLLTKGYRKCTEIAIDEIFILKNCKYDHYREPISILINRAFKQKIYRLKQLIKKIIKYDRRQTN
ncbi:MAG: FkbM family methyltransferase [Patescibacteria group bacterium]|jgi:FkbM family methyltransferase